MTEADDLKSRRELITKLVPYMAISAIKVGMFASPLGVLASAASKYNEDMAKTKERVNDLLPLLPGTEKLRMEMVGSNAVSLIMQRTDIRSCAEQYVRRIFRAEGSEGAPAGSPATTGDEAKFQYVLRLPSKNIYVKTLGELTEAEVSSLRETVRRLNPAEAWIFADQGKIVDERLDPVFVSENKVLRGRLKSMMTAEMLADFFERRFGVAIEPAGEEAAKVVLRLTR